MIDPLIHVLAILFAIPTAHFVSFRYRPLYVSFLGAIFLASLVPASALFLLFVVVQALILCYLVSDLKRSNPWRKYLPYIILLNLFWVDFHSFLLGRYFDTLGVSFSIIRIFMTAKTLVSSRANLKKEYVEWLFVGAFYLPAIIVGPVFSGVDLRKQVLGSEKSLGATSFLYRKATWGLVLAVLCASLFSNFSGIVEGDTSLFPVQIVCLFLQLFAAFWGQSLIAEMTSRIMGISIPANFDKPWLATDIRNFWQRWHISMAQFVMQFIYLPLTINKVNPRIATVAAFVFMGLWHEVAWGYLIWGFAHGTLMAYWPVTPENASPTRRALERIVTFSSVITLSYVANYAFQQE